MRFFAYSRRRFFPLGSPKEWIKFKPNKKSAILISSCYRPWRLPTMRALWTQLRSQWIFNQKYGKQTLRPNPLCDCVLKSNKITAFQWFSHVMVLCKNHIDDKRTPHFTVPFLTKFSVGCLSKQRVSCQRVFCRYPFNTYVGKMRWHGCMFSALFFAHQSHTFLQFQTVWKKSHLAWTMALPKSSCFLQDFFVAKSTKTETMNPPCGVFEPIKQLN